MRLSGIDPQGVLCGLCEGDCLLRVVHVGIEIVSHHLDRGFSLTPGIEQEAIRRNGSEGPEMGKSFVLSQSTSRGVVPGGM